MWPICLGEHKVLKKPIGANPLIVGVSLIKYQELGAIVGLYPILSMSGHQFLE
jgi:hypothetical protein